MFDQRLLLALGVLVLVPVACFVLVTSQPVKIAKTYQVETVILWPRDPAKDLNAQSMEQLNRDVADFMKSESGSNAEFPLVRLGKRTIEVIALGDKQPLSEAYKQKLNALIEKRAHELAQQQAQEEREKAPSAK